MSEEKIARASDARSQEEIEKMCIEDPSNLIKWHITDARLWTKSFMNVCGKLDEGCLLGWFANAIETAKDTPRCKDISVEAEKCLEYFPLGTMIESTIGMGGPSVVFIGGGYLQPFSYLDDYNVEHYKKAEVAVEEKKEK